MENIEKNRYAFWNNKGGTGKTSLAFQSIVRYAQKKPDQRILAIDLCPQANLSELFLGGLAGDGSLQLSKLQDIGLEEGKERKTIGGYFEVRLPSPFTIPKFDFSEFLCTPNTFNSSVPPNVKLLSGDPIVELQANTIAALANTQIPGRNPWLSVVTWLSDYLEAADSEFDTVFIDTNPSFSMYTQIAISAASRLILPLMADDSSRRAIQNVFALIYGLDLPSKIYDDYSFSSKLKTANQHLPKVHALPKNRLTQYMGGASAYQSVMKSVDKLVHEKLSNNKEIFTFDNPDDGFLEIRDFGTTGVIAFAEGAPFHDLKPGKYTINGKDTQLNKDKREECVVAIDRLVDKF